MGIAWIGGIGKLGREKAVTARVGDAHPAFVHSRRAPGHLEACSACMVPRMILQRKALPIDDGPKKQGGSSRVGCLEYLRPHARRLSISIEPWPSGQEGIAGQSARPGGPEGFDREDRLVEWGGPPLHGKEQRSQCPGSHVRDSLSVRSCAAHFNIPPICENSTSRMHCLLHTTGTALPRASGRTRHRRHFVPGDRGESPSSELETDKAHSTEPCLSTDQTLYCWTLDSAVATTNRRHH